MQGVFPPGSYWSLGLPDNWYGTLEWQYPPEQRMGAYEEEGRAVNHIKGGIITADRIVTRNLEIGHPEVSRGGGQGCKADRRVCMRCGWHVADGFGADRHPVISKTYRKTVRRSVRLQIEGRVAYLCCSPASLLSATSSPKPHAGIVCHVPES
eukprot:1159626-Pelagomonas_calceolata.AAC.4